MKVYYIFKIKNEFVRLYKDTPSVLYHILKNIYYLNHDSVEYGYHLFQQLIQTFDKNKLDRDLYIQMHQDIPYTKVKDIHEIHNRYKMETSKLVINTIYMKLEIEQDFSSFYSYLLEKEDNLFVCNFKNTDFFFLE
ncbi:MAG: sporulation inhibitor of replication protein SirA [Bacilli bacterium]|nr:sporulation inhibitor of replication protein SirA [Bacilli bacterium]